MAFQDIDEINNFMCYAINLEGKHKLWANQIFNEKSMQKKISFNKTTTYSDTTSEEESNSNNENIFNLFENKLEDKISLSKFYKEKTEKIKKNKIFEESIKSSTFINSNNSQIENVSSKKNIFNVPKKKSYNSYISMYLENAKLITYNDYLNPFENYCKYIYTGLNHVTINIIVPFIQSGKNIIVIECSKDIEISNLIGLICYKYTLKNYKPPLKDIYYYELKIAHTSHEIYYDLPSLDVTKKFYESYFDNLALIDITLLGNNYSKNVTVYTYDAKSYLISLPSYNIPLSMVRDKCLNMVKSKLGLEKKIEGINLDEIEYVLQKLDNQYENLDLKMPLLQANCDEFVLLRQNSVRGDFTSIYEKKTSTLKNTIISNDKSSNTLDNLLPTISEVIDFQEPETNSTSDSILNDLKCIATFEVERLTSLKIKKVELLEIMKTHIQFISQRNSKVSLVIPWQLLAHFILSKSNDGITSYKIIWIKFNNLPKDNNTKFNSNTLDSKNFFKRIYKKKKLQNFSLPSNNFWSIQSFEKYYFHYDFNFFDENISSAKWKTINFDLPNNYSSSITNIMSSIENNLSALVYMKSDNGRRSPIEAWEKYKESQHSSYSINNL
uniref:CRIM domain-containing protein n=1 Tax=Strongyloides stercoralis TaxID=6248 RepID=A0A0K0DWY6_STRER